MLKTQACIAYGAQISQLSKACIMKSAKLLIKFTENSVQIADLVIFCS